MITKFGLKSQFVHEKACQVGTTSSLNRVPSPNVRSPNVRSPNVRSPTFICKKE